MIESSAKRCIVNNADINSRQDTILANVNSSQGYFYNSTVRGNFDYIWGGGNLYFNQCTMLTIAGTGSGQLTAARTDTSATTSAELPLAQSGRHLHGQRHELRELLVPVRSRPRQTSPWRAAMARRTTFVSWFGCDFATNYASRQRPRCSMAVMCSGKVQTP